MKIDTTSKGTANQEIIYTKEDFIKEMFFKQWEEMEKRWKKDKTLKFKDGLCY